MILARCSIAFLLVFSMLCSGQLRTRRGGTGNSIDRTGAYGEPAATFHGTLKHISGKLITIANEEGESVEIRRTHKTRFVKNGKPVDPASIPPGTALTIDVGKDPDLNPQAINVFVEAGPPSGS